MATSKGHKRKVVLAKPPRAIFFVLGAFAIILFCAFAFQLFSDFFRSRDGFRSASSCVTDVETRIVRGGSLTGVVDDGGMVEIFFGYYDCNEVARGDIVAYLYAGSDEPLVKIVKAVPGDSFALVPAGNVYNIEVNGEALKNSFGEPYEVTPDRYRRFSLYERDYGGSLPEDTYMILSNIAGDSIDSRAFGLVHKSDILGKAVGSRQ